ncbi:unnamed protein product [Auanema sp. JU1783]|nr:unnamed protein product [Auanema sp. JU1783]
METAENAPKSPTLTLKEIRKSGRSGIRSARSLQSIKSSKSNRSTNSVRVFNHGHQTYFTCFGSLHVKLATCGVGMITLAIVCSALIYCVYTSQELEKPAMKLYILPLILIIVILLYLYIGIMQKKARLIFPFIALQIFFVFATAIAIVMISIAVVCRTKFILQIFVPIDKKSTEQDYLRMSLATAVILFLQLFFQLWALRSVCGCFRYLSDLKRFNIRQSQLNFI